MFHRGPVKGAPYLHKGEGPGPQAVIYRPTQRPYIAAKLGPPERRPLLTGSLPGSLCAKYGNFSPGNFLKSFFEFHTIVTI